MKTFSCHELEQLSDNNLKDLFIEVRSYINKNHRIKKESKDLEIYFCYIVRELEIRTKRANN